MLIKVTVMCFLYFQCDFQNEDILHYEEHITLQLRGDPYLIFVYGSFRNSKN